MIGRLLSRWAGNRSTESEPPVVQYDSAFFTQLRSNLSNARQQAEQAEQESSRWSRASDEAERSLATVDMHQRIADRIESQMNWEMARMQAHCNIWGHAMPDVDEDGWAR